MQKTASNQGLRCLHMSPKLKSQCKKSLGNEFVLTRALNPVVQSIASLTSLLKGQLVKCFPTLLSNTLVFLLKNKKSFCMALQKLLTFFQQKILAYIRY